MATIVRRASAFIALLVSVAGQAETPVQTTRHCQLQDLIGTWSLAKIESAEAGVREFYQTNPNEVMRFSSNGAFVYVARRAPYSISDAKRSLDKADAMDGVTYAFRVQGEQLILLRDGTPFEGFRCSIVVRANARTKLGDLLLANLVNRPSLLRIQRKLD